MKKEHDFAIAASQVVQEATEHSESDVETELGLPNGKNPHAVALERFDWQKETARQSI